MSVKFLNTTAGSPPYKKLFSNVAIVPPNTSMAYISTQWAADRETGELVEGVADDHGKQAKIIWENIVAILKELGVGMKDVVHKTVSFKGEFNDEIGMAVVQGQMEAVPDEWKEYALISALTFNQVTAFHRPGIVYTVDMVVAIPSK